MRKALAIMLAASALAAQAQERTLSVAARESDSQRVALVIGNSAYKVGPLRNPVNDARAMSAALRKAGFDVMHGEDLSHRKLFEMTRDFGRKLRPGIVALFYYAGHGLQVRDRNFLIPVEADPQSEEEVPYTSVDVNFLLDLMNRAKSRVNIVILDACRNNPFARSFRSGSSGLAQMDAPSGTLIAYATAPGRVASDGSGDHGLYTQYLLKHIGTPGLPVEILFKRVREGVERETKSQQIPWESSSLKGDFYFTAAAPVAATPPPPPAPPVAVPAGPDPALVTELTFWDAIKASQSAADYQAYLDTYPKGRFAALAKARVNSLKAAASSHVPAAPSASAPRIASVAPTPVASGRMPQVGEAYTYRYTDLWKPSEQVEIVHTVGAVRAQNIMETLSARINGRPVEAETSSARGPEIREWKVGNIALREFAPYAFATELVTAGRAPAEVRGMDPEDASLPAWSVSASAKEEEVTVPAGRFQATRVRLKGQRQLSNIVLRIIQFEMDVWYAPEVKRYVKMTFTSVGRMSGGVTSTQHRDVYELVSYPR